MKIPLGMYNARLAGKSNLSLLLITHKFGSLQALCPPNCNKALRNTSLSAFARKAVKRTLRNG